MIAIGTPKVPASNMRLPQKLPTLKMEQRDDKLKRDLLDEIMGTKDKNMDNLIEYEEDLNHDVSERGFLISDLSQKIQQADKEINFQEIDIKCLNYKVNTFTNDLNDAMKLFKKDLDVNKEKYQTGVKEVQVVNGENNNEIIRLKEALANSVKFIGDSTNILEPVNLQPIMENDSMGSVDDIVALSDVKVA